MDHRSARPSGPVDELRLKAIRARCPEIDAAVKHVAGFARMIKDLSGDKDRLTGWMAAVDHDLPALRSFTRGLHRDIQAVTAELTLPYNSGAVEGTRQQDQGPQDAAVRTRQPRPAAETDLAGLNVQYRHPPTCRGLSDGKTHPQLGLNAARATSTTPVTRSPGNRPPAGTGATFAAINLTHQLHET
jgi:hypothetical protein